MALDVHQCSRCELRFSNASELKDHFEHDHHADPDTFSRYRYPGRSAPESVEPGRRYLLVANQTLHDEHVIAAVRERSEAGAARFVVLVPATHSANLAPVWSAAGDVGLADEHADDVGLAQARWRLRTMIDLLHDAGVDAEGRIGHPEPYTAISRLLEHETFDEILLSTLPPRTSRWMRADLPTRLTRHFHRPVTVLSAR